MQCQELEIPSPWGSIAIKAWGNSANEVVIAVHGLLDNAGSFDMLIPLLPSNFYYICVDLPGHGLSSHFPPHLPIHALNYIVAVRNVTEHFKRDKYIFIGHSFGARLSALYAQLYPNEVSKIVLLDTGSAFIIPPEEFVSSLKDACNMLKKISSFRPENSPSYSYKEIIDKIIDGRFGGTLTFETAQQLAKRMVKKVGVDKYEFTYDQRLRAFINPSYSRGYVRDMLEQYPIKCPAMVLFTSKSKIRLEDSNLKDLFHIPNFKLFEVEGHHHSHHTNPELFVPILTEFLLNQESKL